MTMIIVASIFVSLAYLTTLWKLSPYWYEITLGYDGIVDLIFGSSMTLLFATSPSFIALMTGATTGLIFGLILIGAKKINGYRKIGINRRAGYKVSFFTTFYPPTETYESLAIKCFSFVGTSTKIAATAMWKSFRNKQVTVP